MATVTEPITPSMEKPDALYEFVDGEWKETPRMGAFAGFLATFLVEELGPFVRKNRLGYVFSEVLFRLAPEGLARRPDVAFVSRERWPYKDRFSEDPPAFDVVPDLAVEVISPTNKASEMVDKIRDYFFAGVQLVWVVYPSQRLVYVYTSPEDVRILGEARELEGGTVLPGFRLPLVQLFNVGTEPA